MPFTVDVRSRLEQGLVVTMRQSSERRVTPSAHQVVAALMSPVAPALHPEPGVPPGEERATDRARSRAGGPVAAAMRVPVAMLSARRRERSVVRGGDGG